MGEVGVTQVELEGAESLALGPTEEMRCVFFLGGYGYVYVFQSVERKTESKTNHPTPTCTAYRRRRAAYEMQKVMDRIPQVEASSFWRQINVDYAAVYVNGAQINGGV